MGETCGAAAGAFKAIVAAAKAALPADVNAPRAA